MACWSIEYLSGLRPAERKALERKPELPTSRLLEFDSFLKAITRPSRVDYPVKFHRDVSSIFHHIVLKQSFTSHSDFFHYAPGRKIVDKMPRCNFVIPQNIKAVFQYAFCRVGAITTVPV